jgi:hypothetical protein
MYIAVDDEFSGAGGAFDAFEPNFDEVFDLESVMGGHVVGERFLRQKPTLYVVSNLFSACGGARRCVHKQELQTASSHKQMLYSGETLNQKDLDVWLGLLALSPPRDRNGAAQFKLSSLLGVLQMRNTSAARERVLQSIKRMQAGRIEIIGPRWESALSLVTESAFDRLEGVCRMRINTAVAAVFRHEDRLRIDMKERNALCRQRAGCGLSKWLHALCSTNENCLKFDMEMVRRLSGYKVPSGEAFAEHLERAMDALVDAGAIGPWSADGKGGIIVQPVDGLKDVGACRLLV